MQRLPHVITRTRAWWASRSPAFRLTIAYVAIIAVMSVSFSVVLYRFADTQVTEGLRRQYLEFNRPVMPELRGGTVFGMAPRFAPDSQAMTAAIQPLLDEARRALVLRLAYFNVIIILLGGALSYWLAKRTVRPIEAALDAQSRFTADASHELRTPLAVMRTEIEIARADPALTKAQAFDLLGSNLEEVGKLHSLADSLLRLARSNQQPLALAPAPAAKVVGEAITRVAARAKLADISLVNDTSDLTVQADTPSLIELLVILLDNAIKYSRTGTVIKISTSQHGHDGLITIVDQGRGISSADLPHIFDRFYRADKSRTHSDVEGHGLGLSIAKQIADLHGGVIEVSSTPGKGSTFGVRLRLSSL